MIRHTETAERSVHHFNVWDRVRSPKENVESDTYAGELPTQTIAGVCPLEYGQVVNPASH